MTDIEHLIKRKLTDSEYSSISQCISEPLMYINTPITKNKFKNDSYFGTRELLGILNKDSYITEFRKINNTVTYNGTVNVNMDSKESIIKTLFVECLKNNYSIDFSESIDYDISTPDIEQEIICKKCKSRNIVPVEEHRRALDEASEYYLRCNDCNKKFYF